MSTTGFGLVELFHDILKVTTTPDSVVSISATDNNLLDINGNAIPVGTSIPQVSPGVYELIFYTVPAQGAMVAVSNGVSTENFTTASCTPCPASIPTMPEWSLAIFGLLILNIGVGFLYRKEEIINE